ncbi:hypothetical protein C8A00DRAFT_41427 [Chaetomidium leptoderma]|uniref:Aminoglycoside phosphotransferase domain-containing protein n=1 Tax=Chaetomidium leptoderma TaxID=669021 RepID=A0AAN6VRL7_9PEZI|nr:hypothetical protein C8A00DRAFT_41427 [Chaetomidium leptoderma]
MPPPTPIPQLNWRKDDIEQDKSLPPINWDALRRYATTTRRQLAGVDSPCRLSPEYNKGGLHVVRRIDFEVNLQWLARLQLTPPTPESCQGLLNEVHAMAAVRSRSKIPVPQVFDHDATGESGVGVAFMLTEFIPGDTAMDSFGGYEVHHGETPAQFRDKFHAALADIQTEITSIRFSKIGAIVVTRDGEFDVGPIPNIGGPFDTAADYLEAWARTARFPYKEATIRPRTPAHLVDGCRSWLGASRSKTGPFRSSTRTSTAATSIIDEEYNILSVVDWENAFVGPWELVEFNKELSIVPPAMDGPLFKETEQWMAMEVARADYVKLVQRAEEKGHLDTRLSTVLSDEALQAFAHAF